MCLQPTIVNGRKYPCGTCLECRKYQSYLAGLGFEIVSQKYTHVSFITLTYDNKNLSYIPVSMYQDSEISRKTGTRHYVFCRLSKDVVRRCDVQNPVDVSFPYISFGVQRSFPACAVLRVFNEGEAPINLDEDTWESRQSPLSEKDEFSGRYRYLGTYLIPVVVSRDLQNSLKAFRQSLVRAGIHDPKHDRVAFVYRGCGEYGPKQGRPHFHLVICHCSDVLPYLSDFVDKWRKNYGYVVIKTRSRFKDASSFSSFASYTAEYSKKSAADQHFVQRCGLVPPLRSFVSLGYNKILRKFCSGYLLQGFLGREYSSLTYDDVESFLNRYFSFSFVRSNGKVVTVPQIFKQQSLKYGYYRPRPCLDADFQVVYVDYRFHSVHTPLSLLASIVSKHGDYASLLREFRFQNRFPRTIEGFYKFVLSTPEVSDVRQMYDELYYARKNRERFIKTPF